MLAQEPLALKNPKQLYLACLWRDSQDSRVILNEFPSKVKKGKKLSHGIELGLL